MAKQSKIKINGQNEKKINSSDEEKSKRDLEIIENFTEEDIKRIAEVRKKIINAYKKLHQKHRKYLDKSFEEYYNRLLSIIDKQDFKDILNRDKSILKLYFIVYIIRRLFPDKFRSYIQFDTTKFHKIKFNKEKKENIIEFDYTEEDEKCIKKDLSIYVTDLFFFEEITFSVLNGNIKNLKTIIKKTFDEFVNIKYKLEIEEAKNTKSKNHLSSDDETFITEIKIAKGKIRARNGKPNIRQVAIELDRPDSTFRGQVNEFEKRTGIEFKDI